MKGNSIQNPARSHCERIYCNDVRPLARRSDRSALTLVIGAIESHLVAHADCTQKILSGRNSAFSPVCSGKIETEHLLDGRHFAACVVGDHDAVDHGMHSGERPARAAVARRGLRFTSSSQPIVRLRVRCSSSVSCCFAYDVICKHTLIAFIDPGFLRGCFLITFSMPVSVLVD
jgi:hypothetical protein